MASDDMDHMVFLESVALSDVLVLHKKEATYQGSWKRAGGRSAWFMARRNMDRLLTMMAPRAVPKHIASMQNVLDTLQALDNAVHYQHIEHGTNGLPGSIEATREIIAHLKDTYTAEDIFARIGLRPKGEDGTVLACIRDLRRYLLLVEAEMIAEGVVENEETDPGSFKQFYDRPQTDVYQMIADEFKITREEAKTHVYRALYDAETRKPPLTTGGEGTTRVDITVTGGAKFKESDIVFPNAKEISPYFQAGPVAVASDEHGPAFPLNTVRAERIADGGSHHATLVPWWIERGYYETLTGRVGSILMEAFYTRRSTDAYSLEPIVKSATIPRELADCYRHAKVNGEDYFIMKRGNVPEQLEDQFPRLQIEMNRFEWETSPETYRFMYEEVGEKMILKPEFAAWGREA